MLKCMVIYNPNSGKLTNRTGIKRIYKILENYGYEVEIVYTKYKGHATEITKKAKNVDLLLCAGGDGTLNEVIAGNIARKKKVLLGHIPLGSVNDVAHMYGMSINTQRNIVMLLNGVQKNIDVCLINNQPFVYIACMGAYVDISYATPRKLKEKYGKFAYAIYGVQQLKQNLKYYNIKYTVDDREYQGRFSFIFITNSNRAGGVSNIYDDVKLDDNKFEVLLCDIKSKFDILKAVYYLKRKDIANMPGCTYFKTDNIHLEFDEVPSSWCLDGDEMVHDKKVFDFIINKDNTMLLPTKNIEKLFENVSETEEESEE